MSVSKTEKFKTFNAGHPNITIRCESQAQKEEIDRRAIVAGVPRTTFILDQALGRVGSNTGGNTTPAGGSNATKMQDDLVYLVKVFFNYIGDNGADNIPDDLLGAFEEIERRVDNEYRE